MAQDTNSIKELEGVSIHAWLFANNIKTESGKVLDFKQHRYLFDIYLDDSKYLCCEKAGQIGFSTMGILKTLWLACYKKIDVGYILPTVDMVQKFVGSKVNRMAQQNPAIEHLLKDKDSISQKQIGESYIHYLGAMTDRSAIMLSLDMLVADEYDKSPQDILEIYDSRLQHSNYGYKWVFSNPTKPDWGVDTFFQMSDQKRWNVTHSCGARFILDEKCVDYQAEIYRCPKCKEEITDEERRMGEWYNKDDVKWTGKVEGYTWSGWWIPLWIGPQIPASVIAEHKRTKSPEYFHNFVAGLPYLNTNDALSQPLLEANLTSRVNDQTGRIIIGCDTGHNIHYVLGNKQGIFYHGYINSVAENEALPVPLPNYDPYTELDKLMVRYPTSIMIADQGGDLIGIRKLQAKYRGRVFLCWFTKETRTQQIIRWGEGEEFGRVMVDRNRAIQIVVDEIKERKFPIFGTAFGWQPYFEHWLNMYRVREMRGEEDDPQYNWRWIWKRKGADHLALSTIYMRVGLDRFGQDLAEIIRKDDWLDTMPVADKPFRIPSQYRSVDI